MRLKNIKIQNFKCFKEISLSLSSINLIIGKNNSGKSAFIQSICLIQDKLIQAKSLNESIRKLENESSITFTFKNPAVTPWGNLSYSNGTANVVIAKNFTHQSVEAALYATDTSAKVNIPLKIIKAKEPDAYLCPRLSRRKSYNFNTSLSTETANMVDSNWSNLPAKLNLIMGKHDSKSELFRKKCQNILGFELVSTAFPDGGEGIYAGRWAGNDSTSFIKIDEMGEGVLSLAGFIYDLIFAKDKLFLIEEPENDLHPEALKALLNTIKENLTNNQFIITTHSNIVLKYLGALPDTNIFHTLSQDKDENGIEEKIIYPIENSIESRLSILSELGYDLSDFDLFDGWIILEESSAETIIRDHFIRWYTPSLLGRIATISASGISNVEPKFESLSTLLLYAHLQSRYRKKAWVLVDGDDVGKSAIERLQIKFSNSWPRNNFRAFGQSAFENYYPSIFSQKTHETLSIEDKKDRRAAKAKLLKSVLTWISEDDQRAKSEFLSSASEVIEILKEIEQVFQNV